MAGADPRDMRAVQAKNGVHLDPVGDQIGMGRIADHQIGQSLPAEPEVVDPVAGRHAIGGKRAIDEIGRDRLARRPDRADQPDDDEQRDPGRTASAARRRRDDAILCRLVACRHHFDHHSQRLDGSGSSISNMNVGAIAHRPELA